MKQEELRQRLISFAVNIIRFTKKLPKIEENNIISKQIVRSSTSIGANYSEAIYAHGKLDFIHCLVICRKETNETIYWLDVLSALDSENKDVKYLKEEALTILKIFVSSVKTARNNIKTTV